MFILPIYMAFLKNVRFIFIRLNGYFLETEHLFDEQLIVS
jgi:hypothetical protein